jgi:hypothetical protein
MPSEITIRVAIELSHSSWIVAIRLPDVEKSRLHRLEGGDTAALLTLIDDLRSRVTSWATRRSTWRAASKQAATGSGCIGC